MVEVRIYKYSGSSWSLSKTFEGSVQWYIPRVVCFFKQKGDDIVIFSEPYYSSYRGRNFNHIQMQVVPHGNDWAVH